jgi:patatin-like phospholipase/acyl hydrolase
MNRFKILSLDGGGIRGLYTAVLLAEFEKTYKCKVVDKFDMICGTSSGGFNALALSLGIPASDIVKFYVDNGPLFLSSYKWYEKILYILRQTIFCSKYSGGLSNKYEMLFKQYTMKDAKCLLQILTFNLNTGDIFVFKTPDEHDIKTKIFENVSMIDVVLATTAAPTIYPIHQIKTGPIQGNFIDGGVWAVNPTMNGISETLTNYINKYGYTNYDVLSIHPVTNKYKTINNINKKDKSFVEWGQDLFNVIFEGQKDAIDYYSSTVSEYTNNIYYRFITSDVPEKQRDKISIDNASQESIELLQKMALYDSTLVNNNKQLIDYFFTTDKTYYL